MARISKLRQKISSPFGFWLDSQFGVVFTDPESAEIVINHSSSMNKGALYQNAIEGMGGSGLLTASGTSCDFFWIQQKMYNKI